MQRQLGEAAFHLHRLALDRLADLAVQAHAACRGHVLVERLAHDGVREAVVLGRVRLLDDQAGGDRLVEQVEELVALALADDLERVEVELPPEDRRDREHLVAVVGEVLQPPADDLADALRDPDAPAAGGVGLVEPALGREQAHDLADEERVALGLAVHRLDEGLGRGSAGSVISM